MKEFVTKYRPLLILIILGVSLVVGVALFFTQSKKNTTKNFTEPSSESGSTPVFHTPVPTPIVFSPPPYTQPEQYNTAGSEKVNQAIDNKTKLKKYLPIYIKNYVASNGMVTTLNIYTVPEDPDYLIHIEIYGISYEDQNLSKNENPNLVAFIDSFNEIKKQLTDKGININNIYFKFGQKTYIQATADLWIKTFGLL